MSRKWKIVVGVVIALVIVGCVGAPIAGAVLFRSRIHQQGWGPGIMPRWESGEARQLEVKLVDDDGDGVPDRGVIELPETATLAHGRFGGGRFAPGGFSGFRPGRGMPFGRQPFGPFFIIGGLVRLALFAGIIVLGIVFYRQWRKAHPVTPPAAPPASG
jgi:hypothetical protein